MPLEAGESCTVTQPISSPPDNEGIVTSSWPDEQTESTGQVAQQSGRAFTFDLQYETVDFNEDYRAQLFVHPSGKYALVVLQAIPSTDGTREITVGVLQKAAASDTPPTTNDLIGDWQGTGVELNTAFEVVEQFDSTASFTPSEGLVLSGADRDGAYEGIVIDENDGAASAEFSHQGDNEVGVYTLMSDDRNVVAVAMIRDLSENNGALCNQNDPYADMSVHKFALWDRVID